MEGGLERNERTGRTLSILCQQILEVVQGSDTAAELVGLHGMMIMKLTARE